MSRRTLAGAPTTLVPPSIHQLGLWLAAVKAEYRRLDEDTSGKHDLAEKLLFERELALQHVISTLPAVTIADAAVQIATAWTMADGLQAYDWEKPENQARLGDVHNALRRLVLSALPVVADAAGLDLAAMCWDDADLIRANTFYGAETEA